MEGAAAAAATLGRLALFQTSVSTVAGRSREALIAGYTAAKIHAINPIATTKMKSLKIGSDGKNAIGYTSVFKN